MGPPYIFAFRLQRSDAFPPCGVSSLCERGEEAGFLCAALRQACPWACGLEVCAVGRGCHVSHCFRASEAGFLPQQTLPTTTAVDQPPPLPLSSSSLLQLLPLSLRRCETLTPQLPYRATKEVERGVFHRRLCHGADKEMLQREDIRQPG